MKFKAILLTLSLLFLTACESEKTKRHNESLDDIDYNLTEMSATIVYSQIFDLVSNPSEYTDARFIIKGEMVESEDAETGEKFYAIIIADATACCAQGLEVFFPEEIPVPEELPATVTIQGTIGTQTVGDIEFAHVNIEELT